jgi:molybdopterin-guanine dinucleotide biosynthesis protein
MIKVTVSGVTASGKTTIVQLIEDALLEHGIKVIVDDVDRDIHGGPHPSEFNDMVARSLGAKGLVVQIVAQNAG